MDEFNKNSHPWVHAEPNRASRYRQKTWKEKHELGREFHRSHWKGDRPAVTANRMDSRLRRRRLRQQDYVLFRDELREYNTSGIYEPNCSDDELYEFDYLDPFDGYTEEEFQEDCDLLDRLLGGSNLFQRHEFQENTVEGQNATGADGSYYIDDEGDLE